MLPPKSDRAFLESLEPSSGKLSPSFSADIYHYTLDVPYRVSSVTFDAQAGENGTVSVSRKTLQKAGSTTSITITATSENQKQKTQYLVDVNRAEEPEEPEWEDLFGRTDPIGRGAASSLFARRDRICVGCRRGRTVFDLSGKGGRGRFGQCQPGKAESRGDFDGNQNYRCVIGQKEPAGVYGYCEPGVGRIRFRRIIPVFSHRVTAVRRDFGAAIFPGHFGIYITCGFGCAVRDLPGERLGRGDSFHQSKDALIRREARTEIVVTVRSEDRKTTKQYTVSVVRAEEGGSASERAGAGGTGMAGGNSGSNVAAKSNDGESPQSGEEPYIPFKVGETEEAAESAAEAGVPLGQTEEGTRETVFRENNQFSAFVAGMVAAVICVALGMGLVFLYEKGGKRKKL